MSGLRIGVVPQEATAAVRALFGAFPDMNELAA